MEEDQTTVPCRSYSSELSIFTLTISPGFRGVFEAT